MAIAELKTNPMLMRSRLRMIAGLVATASSLLSVVVILAYIPYPLLALMPLPTLMLGTVMITLELRNRVST
jgi:hypothetical protein